MSTPSWPPLPKVLLIPPKLLSTSHLGIGLIGKNRPGPVTRIRSAGVVAVAAPPITGTSARTTDPTRERECKHPDGASEPGSGNDSPGSVADHGRYAGAHKRDGRRTRIADRQLARNRVVGGIARGNRYRSTAVQAAENSLSSYRGWSARSHRQRDHPVQPPCAGPSRSLGATRQGVARYRPPPDRRRHDLRARRRGRVPGARVDHPAQRDRGVWA